MIRFKNNIHTSCDFHATAFPTGVLNSITIAIGLPQPLDMCIHIKDIASVLSD